MLTNRLRSSRLRPAVQLLSAALVVCLSGCNMLPKVTIPQGPGGKPDQSQAGNPQQAASAPAGSKPMDGYWKLAFSFNDNVQSCHFRLTQNGDKFSGQGTDDHNSKPFLIENGLIRQDEVVFYKRYEQPDNPNQPPVEYNGKIDFKSGYVSGKYLISFQGKDIAGDWEAQKEGAQGDAAQEQGPPPEEQQAKAPPPQSGPPNGRAPDISGKWNMGYEYQFKTMHSTVFIEQHGDKLTGHGVDENTKENFVIEKGWYKYPKVTMIRKYPPLKGKTGSKPERRMTFKADVSWVSESDYTGPYMVGKTEGGGNWEGQLIR